MRPSTIWIRLDFWDIGSSRGVVEEEEERHKGVGVREEDVKRILRLTMPYVNESLLQLRALFSGDPSTTLKMGMMLFVLARCALLSLAKFGSLGAFTIPKIFISYSTHFSAYGNLCLRRFRDPWESCSHKKAAALALPSVLLALSFLKYFYGLLEWFAVVAGVYPNLAKAVASATRFRLDINALTLTAVIATVCMEDYTEAATIVFLFSVADWLELSGAHKASTVVSSLMSLAPRKAVIAENGIEVDVDEVVINTIVSVKAGESIPIDGVVVDGSCDVDEKTLTGEFFPVSKQIDSTVLAATINLNGVT